ncbi:MAG: hypothetical protein R3C70_12330 [Geminicoccaceae bacterium]
MRASTPPQQAGRDGRPYDAGSPSLNSTRPRRVSGGATRVQILRLPAETGRTQSHENRERRGLRFLNGCKVQGFIHVHQMRCDVQHQARFDLAGMDADALFMLADETIGQSQLRPGTTHHEHVVMNAQFAGDDLHHLDIAAMAVENDHLAHTCPGDACADLEPVPAKCLGADRKCARKIDMLLAAADPECGKHAQGQVVGCQFEHGIDDGIVDHGIDAERQVRPVLFGGAYRHDRDEMFGIDMGEIARTHLVPPARRQSLVTH